MNYPNSGFVPPAPRPQSGPSCWLIGGLTCTGIIVIVIALIGIATYSFLHSKAGKEIKNEFHGVVKMGEELPACDEKMMQIRGAIIRYHERTGSYPKNLKVLMPEYLTDPSVMHCAVDSNPNPSHTSFTYKRPAEGADSDTPLLSVSVTTVIPSPTATNVMVNSSILTLGGDLRQTETMNGKPVENYQVSPA